MCVCVVVSRVCTLCKYGVVMLCYVCVNVCVVLLCVIVVVVVCVCVSFYFLYVRYFVCLWFHCYACA